MGHAAYQAGRLQRRSRESVANTASQGYARQLTVWARVRIGLVGLQEPAISTYTLWEYEELLGIGALKELDARSGEIKSMRTADAYLRTGVAATLLEHIIAEARRRTYTRLSLETGSGAPFEPALALYRKRGFANGGPFSAYEQSAFNQFLHLDLIQAAGE